jgi:hypothetical protein
MKQQWKYVGGHDAVDLDGVGTVVRGEPFDTDLDLSDREDFEPVATKSTTKKES